MRSYLLLLVVLLICGKSFQYWGRNEKDSLGVGVSPSYFLLSGGGRAGGVFLAGLMAASGMCCALQKSASEESWECHCPVCLANNLPGIFHHLALGWVGSAYSTGRHEKHLQSGWASEGNKSTNCASLCTAKQYLYVPYMQHLQCILEQINVLESPMYLLQFYLYFIFPFHAKTWGFLFIIRNSDYMTKVTLLEVECSSCTCWRTKIGAVSGWPPCKECLTKHSALKGLLSLLGEVPMSCASGSSRGATSFLHSPAPGKHVVSFLQALAQGEHPAIWDRRTLWSQLAWKAFIYYAPSGDQCEKKLSA